MVTRKGRTKGFTLVELLVVIGIIALLIGILMPALTRAREQANTTKCGANLHTIGIALTMYVSQYNAYPGHASLVSGTTATGPDGVVGAGDPAAQARFIIDTIEAAIGQLGGALRDVVRTRVYVRNIADWEAVARVHGERFGAIRPANTLVQAQLVGDEYLVEIEAEAQIGAGDAL